jgi:hypothetical protein
MLEFAAPPVNGMEGGDESHIAYDPKFDIIDTDGEPLYLGQLGLLENLLDGGERKFTGNGMAVKLQGLSVVPGEGRNTTFDLFLVAANKAFDLPTYGFAFPSLNGWAGNSATATYSYLNFNRAEKPYNSVDLVIVAKTTVSIDGAGKATVANFTPMPGWMLKDGKVLLKYDPSKNAFYCAKGTAQYFHFGYAIQSYRASQSSTPPVVARVEPILTALGALAQDKSVDCYYSGATVAKKRVEGGVQANRPDLMAMLDIYQFTTEDLVKSAAKPSSQAEPSSAYFDRARVHDRINRLLGKIPKERLTTASLATLWAEAATKPGIQTVYPDKVKLIDVPAGSEQALNYDGTHLFALDVDALIHNRFGPNRLLSPDLPMLWSTEFQSFTGLKQTTAAGSDKLASDFTGQDLLVSALYELSEHTTKETEKAETARFLASLTIVGGIAYGVYDFHAAAVKGDTWSMVGIVAGTVVENAPWGKGGYLARKLFAKAVKNIEGNAVGRFAGWLERVKEGRIEGVVGIDKSLGSRLVAVEQDILKGQKLLAELPDGFNTAARAKFIQDLIDTNTLGWTKDDILKILRDPVARGLEPWDKPLAVLSALKRASDSHLEGIVIKKQKFPNIDTWPARNAKAYQGEGMNGASDIAITFVNAPHKSTFDAIGRDGVLIDRKWGHKGIFEVDEDTRDLITMKPPRDEKMLAQISRQLRLVGNDGSKVRWEISGSAEDAALIEKFFHDQSKIPGIDLVKVVYVPQKRLL